jgi:hypothetical protein
MAFTTPILRPGKREICPQHPKQRSPSIILDAGLPTIEHESNSVWHL